jgi:hypothetical protein
MSHDHLQTSRNSVEKEKDKELSRRSFLVGGAAITASSIALGAMNQAEAVDKTKSTRAKSMLVKNALVLVTMDKDRREIGGGGMYIEEGVIKQVDTTDNLPKSADVVLDMKGHLVLPGLERMQNR